MNNSPIHRIYFLRKSPLIHRARRKDLPHMPEAFADNRIKLLYPLFDGDSKLISPGQTRSIDCSFTARIVETDTTDARRADRSILAVPIPENTKSLILHPAVISAGERITLCLTNASNHTFIIAKDTFDITSRLGHGIFRRAEVIRYECPIAQALPLPYH